MPGIRLSQMTGTALLRHLIGFILNKLANFYLKNYRLNFFYFAIFFQKLFNTFHSYQSTFKPGFSQLHLEDWCNTIFLSSLTLLTSDHLVLCQTKLFSFACYLYLPYFFSLSIFLVHTSVSFIPFQVYIFFSSLVSSFLFSSYIFSSFLIFFYSQIKQIFDLFYPLFIFFY